MSRPGITCGPKLSTTNAHHNVLPAIREPAHLTTNSPVPESRLPGRDRDGGYDTRNYQARIRHSAVSLPMICILRRYCDPIAKLWAIRRRWG